MSGLVRQRWVALFFFGVVAAGAVAEPVVEPASVGMSAERLARIGPAIDAYIERGEIAGAVTLIARRGQIVHHEAHGFMDIEARTPMRKDALFRLASQTKPVAAVAALILNEQARLLLDAPAARYIPEFGALEVAVPLDPAAPGEGRQLVEPARAVTPRHFLTHTSGMGSAGPWGLVTEADYPGPRRPGETVTDVVRRYAEAPLAFHPGEYWQYSPVAGINVVAALVEVISAQSFGEFTQSNIFDPLGMVDTHFYVPQAKLDRLPTAYRRTRDGGLTIGDPASPESRFVARGDADREVFFSGAGNLVSTARDYFRFAQMLLDGGKLGDTRILSRKSVDLMRSNNIGDTPALNMLGPGTRFGLTVSVLEDPGREGTAMSRGVYRWGGATGVTFWIDPAEELVGIYMMQLWGHQPLAVRQEFQLLTYAAIDD